MKIRRAKISDAKSVTKLYNELREYELSLLKGETKEIQMVWEPKKTVKMVKRWMSGGRDITLIMEDNGHVAGFISCDLDRKHKDALFDIYVRKEFRRKGFGKMLVGALIPYVKKRGCITMTLDVYSANRNAKAVYKRLGFKLVSEKYKRRI